MPKRPGVCPTVRSEPRSRRRAARLGYSWPVLRVRRDGSAARRFGWRRSRYGVGRPPQAARSTRGRPRGPAPTSSTARRPRRRSSRTAASGARSRSWSRARAPTARASSSTRTSSTTTTAPAARLATPATLAPATTLLAPNGTYTYPTDPVYAEQRRRPGRAPGQAAPQCDRFPDHPQHAQGPRLGRDHDRNRQLAPQPRQFPHGANVTAPAELFLTVHGSARSSFAPADSQPIKPAPQVSIDASGAARSRCSSPTACLGPGRAHRSPRAPASGSGTRRPAGTSSRASRRPPTRPGRRRRALRSRPPSSTSPSASSEPWQHTFPPDSVFADPAWWRDRQQGNTLADGDVSPVPRQGRLRQARGRGHGQHARQARRHAARRAR